MNIVTAFLVLPLLLHPTAPAEEEGLHELLDAVWKRMQSHPEYESFSASVVATETRMDGDWKPERSDVVRKRIVQRGDEHSEEILEATRTEKGSTKDVTKKYREEREKELQKQRREREKRRRKRGAKRDDPEAEAGKKGFSLSGPEMFPFSSERRTLYAITRLADTSFEDRPVIVLRTEALAPSKDLLQGTYQLDAETLDVLEVDLVPSKNPRFVKEMNMRLSFAVLPGDYFVVEKMRMKVHAGFLFKKVRMLVEESYEDHRIPAEDDESADPAS